MHASFACVSDACSTVCPSPASYLLLSQILSQIPLSRIPLPHFPPQRLVLPLTGLTSLDLSRTKWAPIPHYATHWLSQLTALSELKLHACEGMLASHAATLYLLPGLR